MTDLPLLFAYLAAITVLTMTPGVDTALVLRSAAIGGPRPASFASAGIVLGCLIWGAAVALGLGALLHASETAYTAVRYIGAAYLLWLGAKLMFAPRSALASTAETCAADGKDAFWRGFLTNMLNPKMGVFYVTFLPQFIPHGAQVAPFTFFLAALHGAVAVIWFALLIAATVPLGEALRRPGVVATLDRLTGGIFIAFGLRLAATR